MFLERVDVVAHYDREVHSPSRGAEAAVGDRARQFVRPTNIRPSPGSTCSSATASAASIAGRKELTFDHVVPRAQGGRTTWENVATACAPCNLKKGGRTPRQAHMHIAARADPADQLAAAGPWPSFPPNYLHESWRDYLYWDVELEARAPAPDWRGRSPPCRRNRGAPSRRRSGVERLACRSVWPSRRSAGSRRRRPRLRAFERAITSGWRM
jgi:5-methylcytosine-specific restriction endonuclease McrA